VNAITVKQTMEYEFRAAEPADRDWVYNLKKDAYRGVVERQFGTWDEQWQQEHFDGRWNPSISRIVTVHGENVGLLAFEEREHFIWIDEIVLVTAWRGRGVGTKILSGLMSDARARAKPLRLQVLHDNIGAIRLYESLGFKQMESSETHHVMEAV
jgi:ribosomal protein S18 acetylase RimI-like enzyme